MSWSNSWEHMQHQTSKYSNDIESAFQTQYLRFLWRSLVLCKSSFDPEDYIIENGTPCYMVNLTSSEARLDYWEIPFPKERETFSWPMRFSYHATMVNEGCLSPKACFNGLAKLRYRWESGGAWPLLCQHFRPYVKQCGVYDPMKFHWFSELRISIILTYM